MQKIFLHVRRIYFQSSLSLYTASHLKWKIWIISKIRISIGIVLQQIYIKISYNKQCNFMHELNKIASTIEFLNL